MFLMLLNSKKIYFFRKFVSIISIKLRKYIFNKKNKKIKVKFKLYVLDLFNN